jgi:hypothetical protein
MIKNTIYNYWRLPQQSVCYCVQYSCVLRAVYCTSTEKHVAAKSQPVPNSSNSAAITYGGMYKLGQIRVISCSYRWWLSCEGNFAGTFRSGIIAIIPKLGPSRPPLGTSRVNIFLYLDVYRKSSSQAWLFWSSYSVVAVCSFVLVVGCCYYL